MEEGGRSRLSGREGRDKGRDGGGGGSAVAAARADIERVLTRPEASRMSPEEYLERYSVTAYMKDLLTVLLENRPEQPLDQMADYFNCAVNGVAPIMRSYRYIRLTKRNRQAFMDNLAQAYAIMCRSSEMPGGGLTGAHYLRLLHMVCSDFPPEVVHGLTQVLDKKEGEAISFPVFVAGINACLLYEEFFEHAERVFNACDTGATGLVERGVFMAVLRQINSQPQDAEHPCEGWNIPGTSLMDRVNAALAASERGGGGGSGAGGVKGGVSFPAFVSAVIHVFVAQGGVQ